jgi:hypothetical protein
MSYRYLIRSTAKRDAQQSGSLTYFGKVCKKHPDLKGERHTIFGTCLGRGCKSYINAPEGYYNLASRRSNEKVKEEVFKHYGGKCVRCGEADFDMLTIDHKNQKGAEHRKQEGIKSGASTLRWLCNHNYPKGFQLLCYNCNIKLFRIYQRKLRRSY